MSHPSLANKRVLLGICGSIAAYKSAYLLRELRRQGAEVRVVTTASAQAFVSPLTLQALCGHPVESEQFGTAAGNAMRHIDLARWAELIIVAPATANFIAKLAHGVADDLLSTVCIAAASNTVALAPAMNKQMWLHPAVQANVQQLQRFGIALWGPERGEQACGDDGEGRMLEPPQIIQCAIRWFCSNQALAQHKVVVTAGPTREMIDPVRYISNRSCGRMGFALAQAAAEQGAEVHLVSGPVALETPPRVKRYDVGDADAMLHAVMKVLPDATIFIACAAVSDYKAARRTSHKLKRGAQHAKSLSLQLTQTPDIVLAVKDLVKDLNPRPFMVGFAAETESLESNAKKKLLAKGLDMIIANRVGDNYRYGFDSLDNEVIVVRRNHSIRNPIIKPITKLGPDSKDNLGWIIMEQIVDYYKQTRHRSDKTRTA